jgi:nitric oxide reductase subunit C
VTETQPVSATAQTTGSTAASGGAGGETASASPSEAELAAGLAVYRKYYCGACHTLDAAETRGTFGPNHNGLGATAAQRIQEPNYSGSATTPAEYIHESIVDPSIYIVDGFAVTSHRMPPYTMLPVEELDALVLFLVNQ